MLGSWDQGSGIIIIIAYSRGRPERVRNSMVLSNMAESLPFALMIGKIFPELAPKRSALMWDSRACMRFTFPRRVLISPLWMRYR